MDFFTGIDQHLGVLRSVLGVVPAEGLTQTMGALPDDVVVRVLVEATAVVTSLDAVRAVAAGVIAARSGRDAGHGGLAQVRGHRSPVTLVQEITGTSKGDAIRQVRLGEALLQGEPAVDDDPGADTAAVPVVEVWHAPLGAAVLAGVITTAKQDVIRRNLGNPPNDDPDTVDAWRTAVEQLIGEASERTVEELGRAARVVRDVLDPDGAERRYQGRYEARSFRTWTDADGVAHGSFVFDDHGHAWIRAVIDAALRPRTGGPRFVDPADKAQADALVGDPRTNDQLCYDLILDLLHAGTLADAKTVFGVKQPGIRIVRIVSTGPSDAGGYVEETGEPVPATFLTQHACDTGVTDCTLDTDGNPLYLGREARLFTPAQKITLALRDGGCRIPGCDRPAHYCEAHHIDEYAKGGRTDIDRGILLCRFHHTTLHHHDWHITRHRLGDFTLHRPGEPPIILKPRLALTYTWTGIDPPPHRFRPAA